MNIGPYTFTEFRELTERFHGCAAPGILLGGRMVTAARAALPEGTLFEALVETLSCLPDAVQMLTPCSVGNKRLHVVNHGKMALSLFDKYNGRGIRCFIDPSRLGPWPEIRAWFMKEKSKEQQDSALLEQEIEEAGASVMTLADMSVHDSFLGKKSGGPVALCPGCGESYPRGHGDRCLFCQGETPFAMWPRS
ncbi:MAG: formylmethanofuran dehydrogenase subunit E family protein [Desulfovibrio sp.]|jgi:formylmethanofuran dehydrogenase subunit E|nr:formylmethanofuran dehydrogenase subunit E family protein [Desulfovibrio sp.]